MTQDDENFQFSGPAVISFSGGRTSGYLLWRVLQANAGSLPAGTVVCFDNTGREMPGTLAFVHECSQRWGVPITWLEYARCASGPTFRVVTYETASRNGEPLDALFQAKSYLPNPVARFCTIEAKIRTTKRYLMSLGWKHWTNVVGLRADEPKRVARATAPQRDRWRNVCPLAAAEVEEIDVLNFWRQQPFDLRLAGPWEGNCDGCFLKSRSAISRMLAAHPERMAWWAAWEGEALHGPGRGAWFRKDRPSYADMTALVAAGQPAARTLEDDQELPCDAATCGV